MTRECAVLEVDNGCFPVAAADYVIWSGAAARSLQVGEAHNGTQWSRAVLLLPLLWELHHPRPVHCLLL